MFLYSYLVKIKRFINGEISTKKLQKNGMVVGKKFHRGAGCFIDPSHCFLITIGDNVTMSINVTVLAHDASTEKLIGYTKIGHVYIEDNVFIGAGTIILPGVRISKNSIVAAGSVVTRDIESDCVYGGNPAHRICSLTEYKEKHINIMDSSKKFSDDYTMRHKLSDLKKQELKDATVNKIAYIK